MPHKSNETAKLVFGIGAGVVIAALAINVMVDSVSHLVGPDGPMGRAVRQQQEDKAQLANEFNAKTIEIPASLYRADVGVYEVRVPTSTGPRDCIANVTRTTHGYKNVALTDCRP